MENGTARGLMFLIRAQVIELEPMPGEELGRPGYRIYSVDFPREDIYFCLESKRLNVIRKYESPPICAGIYSVWHDAIRDRPIFKMVRHGRMFGCVLYGKVSEAMSKSKQIFGSDTRNCG